MVANEINTRSLDNKTFKVRNYLVQNCAVCKQEMELVAGSIIFGNKWYHKDCYDTIQPRISRKLIEDF